MQYHGEAGQSDLGNGKVDQVGPDHSHANKVVQFADGHDSSGAGRRRSHHDPFSMSINLDQYNDPEFVDDNYVGQHDSRTSSLASEGHKVRPRGSSSAETSKESRQTINPFESSAPRLTVGPIESVSPDRRRTTSTKIDTLHMDSRATVIDLLNGKLESSDLSGSVRTVLPSQANGIPNDLVTVAGKPHQPGHVSAWSQGSAVAGGMTALIEQQSHFEARDAGGPSHAGTVDLKKRGKIATFALVMSTNFIIGYTISYINFLMVKLLKSNYSPMCVTHDCSRLNRLLDCVYTSSVIIGLALGSAVMLGLSRLMASRAAAIFSWVSTAITALSQCFGVSTTGIPWQRFLLGFWVAMAQGFTYQYVTQTIVLCPHKTKKQMRMGTAFAFNAGVLLALCITAPIVLAGANVAVVTNLKSEPDELLDAPQILSTIGPVILLSISCILIFLRYLRYDTPQEYIKRELRVHAEAQLQNIYEADDKELLGSLLLHLKDELASRSSNRAPLALKLVAGIFDPSTVTVLMLSSSCTILMWLGHSLMETVSMTLVMSAVNLLGSLFHVPLGARNVTRVVASVLQFLLMIPATILLWRNSNGSKAVFIIFMVNGLAFTTGYGSPMWPTVAAMKSLIIDTRAVQVHLTMLWLGTAFWIVLHELVVLKYIALGILVNNAVTIVLAETFEVGPAKIPQCLVRLAEQTSS